jgi:mannose-6-phosphate isomerase-like protein (cupin superfamily)
MQTFSDNLSVEQNKKKLHIRNMLLSSLSNVPFHENTQYITRYFAENFPVHMAVHEVSPILKPPVEYTQLHVHDEEDEINIILSQQNLLYKIQIGDEEYKISNNSCIWIPRGMMHAANVLSGAGYFITLRIN